MAGNIQPITVTDGCTCCKVCEVAEDGSSYDLTDGACYTYGTNYYYCAASQGVTFSNNTGSDLTIVVSGFVDDDVKFNGVVYEAGSYPFNGPDPDNWNYYGNPCGSDNATNGAHKFSKTFTLSIGSNFLLQGQDNGFSGYINCKITASA